MYRPVLGVLVKRFSPSYKKARLISHNYILPSKPVAGMHKKGLRAMGVGHFAEYELSMNYTFALLCWHCECGLLQHAPQYKADGGAPGGAAKNC